MAKILQIVRGDYYPYLEKILPITLTREQTYSLTPTKLENGYLAIYRNDETKKKTKFLTIQFSVTDERVSDD